MNKYEFFYKCGDSSDYEDPSDTNILSFKAEDDFQAYVLILAYLLRDEIDDFSKRDYEYALESLQDNFKDEITIEWIRKMLSPRELSRFPYNDDVELYYIKRNGKFIDKFVDVPDFFKNRRIKAEIERLDY